MLGFVVLAIDIDYCLSFIEKGEYDKAIRHARWLYERARGEASRLEIQAIIDLADEAIYESRRGSRHVA